MSVIFDLFVLLAMAAVTLVVLSSAVFETVQAEWLEEWLTAAVVWLALAALITVDVYMVIYYVIPTYF